MMHAASVTAESRLVIPTNVTGSVGEICTTSDCITNVTPHPPSSPSVSPIASCQQPLLRISQDTCLGWAPNAIRTPISDVRCVTAYDVTA
jgi:hypothetical protein